MTEQKKRRLKWIAAALVLGVIAILAWQHYRGGNAADGLASGNGRIEATEIDVAAKYAGRVRELNKSWFGAVIQVINQLTMLSIILTGAALIREREHGTIEHLLIMPVTPFEIMTSKVWARGLVVLVAAGLSLAFIVQGLLAVPIAGAALFLAGAALHLIVLAVIGAVFSFTPSAASVRPSVQWHESSFLHGGGAFRSAAVASSLEDIKSTTERRSATAVLHFSAVS